MIAEYVRDTHALLWSMYAPSRLGKAALEAFTKADAGSVRIHVPAVAVAETIMVIERGRLSGSHWRTCCRVWKRCVPATIID